MSEVNHRIIIDSITSFYSNEKADIEVFRSVSFTANAGTIFSFFGPNGCGKSTLLRSIAGLHKVKEGEVTLPSETGVNTRISILPQDFRSSFFKWTNLENNIILTLPNPIKNRKSYIEKIHELKHRFEIDLDLHLKPHQCSGGMLQQAAILRAFASDPQIILADEPFSALDINTSNLMKKNFIRLVKEKNIFAFVVLHSLHDIVEISDQVLLIPDRPFTTNKNCNSFLGKIIFNSPTITEHQTVHKTFIEMAEKFLSNTEKLN